MLNFGSIMFKKRLPTVTASRISEHIREPIKRNLSESRLWKTPLSSSIQTAAAICRVAQ
jgi:hypothetical protein